MVQLRQRTWMTYRFCFFTSSCALYDFFQKSLRNFVSGTPFKRIWKAAGLIRKFGIDPMKIRSIFFVVWQSFSFAEFLLLFYSFLADRSKRSANSPENYPSFWFGNFLNYLYPKTRTIQEPLHWIKILDFAKCEHVTKCKLLTKSLRRPFTLWWIYLSPKR